MSGEPAVSVPPTSRRIAWWDVALTIVLLIGLTLLGLWGAFMGMATLAFMDTCPPEGCDGSPVYNRWGIGLALWAVVCIASVVVLVVRRRAWWIPVIGIAGMVAVWWGSWIWPW